jgi:hypothetical protein
VQTHSILNLCRNHFSQLQNERDLIDVRPSEVHTAEPLVPEPRASEVEKAV